MLIITGRKFFHTESFYTAVLFHTRNLLQADAFIYAQKPLHTEAITHRNFYTGASTHKCNFYRWKHTHIETVRVLLHAKLFLCVSCGKGSLDTIRAGRPASVLADQRDKCNISARHQQRNGSLLPSRSC